LQTSGSLRIPRAAHKNPIASLPVGKSSTSALYSFVICVVVVGCSVTLFAAFSTEDFLGIAKPNRVSFIKIASWLKSQRPPYSHSDQKKNGLI
jgi:hypothetical protein